MWVTIALFPFWGFGQLSFPTIAIGYSWIAFASALLILLLQTQSLQFMAGVLRNRLLRFFGKVSYTLYLFHSAVLGLMFLLLSRRGPTIAGLLDLGVVCGALIVNICLAASTWYLFEKRLIQLGHRFAYRNSTVLNPAPQ
jgi:peptidoglycan/LPS O-acetylase OafA/YrhL